MFDAPAHIAIRDLELEFEATPDDAVVLERLVDVYLRYGVFNNRSSVVYHTSHSTFPGRRDVDAARQVSEQVSQFQRLIGKYVGRLETEGSLVLEPADRVALEAKVEQFRRWMDEWAPSADLYKLLGDWELLRNSFAASSRAYGEARRLGYRPTKEIIELFCRFGAVASVSGPTALFYAEVAMENGQDKLAEQLLTSTLAMPYETDVAGEVDLFAAVDEDQAQVALCITKASDMLTDILERRRSRARSKAERDRLSLEIARLCYERQDLIGALTRMAQMDMAQCEDKDFAKLIAGRLVEQGDHRFAFDLLTALTMDDEVKALLSAIKRELERRGESDTVAYVTEFTRESDFIKTARRHSGRAAESATQMALGDHYETTGKPIRALRQYVAGLLMGYGDVPKALEKIEKILDNRPSDLPLDLLMKLGEHFAEADDPEQAVIFYSRVLEENPTNLECRRALRTMYDRILARNPNRPGARIRSGDLYLMGRNFNQAVEEFKYAAQFPQAEAQASRRLALAYRKSQNLSMAVDCYAGVNLRDSDGPALLDLLSELERAELTGEALRLGQMMLAAGVGDAGIRERVSKWERQVAGAGGEVFIDQKMKKLIGDHAIGRFRYIRQIGSGGMGVVHQVRDIKRGKDMALKILREGVAQSGKAVNRFFREARIAATLNHPNIVGTYDYNINPISGQSYILMEYVEGRSLRHLIEERLDHGLDLSLQDIGRMLLYCSQICDALQATIERGIIHRDIKPDNILVTDDDHVKITDFGIMHMQAATFTPSGALVGTPRYMSPEQVEGTRIDGRSDLYSLGIIMYELLVGTPPFVSGDVSYQQVHVDPVSVKDIFPIVPEEVAAIVMGCLTKSPSERPQTAMELKHAIERVLQHLPIESGKRPRKVAPPRPLEEENTTA